MFHSTTSNTGEALNLRNNSFLKRAALFGGALLLLWLAFQLLPSPPPDSSPVYSDGTGAIATKPAPSVEPDRDTGSFKLGYVTALLLLAGGGAFAIYLRRRSSAVTPLHTPIQVLSATQLAPGQQLRLVSCAGEVLLLGLTASQITLLKSFPASSFETASPDGATLTSTAGPWSVSRHDTPKGQTFASLLQHFAAPAEPARLEGQQ